MATTTQLPETDIIVLGGDVYTKNSVTHAWTVLDGCRPMPAYDLTDELLERISELEAQVRSLL